MSKHRTVAPKGWDRIEGGTVPNEPHETFWARARNDRGMRDPQLAVETHDEQERYYTRTLRRLIGSTAMVLIVVGGGLAGCARHAAPRPLADAITVAQYPDGSFSVDAYGADGELLTTAHLAKDAKLADVFPVGCQPDDGDMLCGQSGH